MEHVMDKYIEQLMQLKAELKELEKALNMEEPYSQFHPKIPYKWKYERELKRTKRQSQYIQKLQAERKAIDEFLGDNDLKDDWIKWQKEDEDNIEDMRINDRDEYLEEKRLSDEH